MKRKPTKRETSTKKEAPRKAAVGKVRAKKHRAGSREQGAGPAGKPVPPSEPLKITEHEAFVMRCFAGRNQREAYQDVYGGSMKAARPHGARLAARPEVAARLAWMKEQEQKRLAEEVPLSKIEAVRKIFDTLNFTIVDVVAAVTAQTPQDGGALLPAEITPAQRVAALLCTEMKMTPAGPAYKMTPWIDRLKQLGDWLGWNKQEVKVSGRLQLDGLGAIARRVRSVPFEVAFSGGGKAQNKDE